MVRRRNSQFTPLENSTLSPVLLIQLVNKDTNETVAESHSHRRSSIFRKPRDMSLEISQAVSDAVDVVLLTFILVWKERQRERSHSFNTSDSRSIVPPMSG